MSVLRAWAAPVVKVAVVPDRVISLAVTVPVLLVVHRSGVPSLLMSAAWRVGWAAESQPVVAASTEVSVVSLAPLERAS